MLAIFIVFGTNNEACLFKVEQILKKKKLLTFFISELL